MDYLFAATAVASTFNLNCAGTLEIFELNDTTSKPFEYTFRVDLEQGQWCENECKARHDLADAGPVQITFQDKTETVGRTVSKTTSFVSRETGEYHALASIEGGMAPPTMLVWKGQCEAAPFTGFPEFETKF